MSTATSKQKKKFKAPDAIVLIIVLMLLSAALTYILPAGTYERVLDSSTGREMVDPNSFHSVANTPINLWGVLKSFHQGMNESASIINFLLIIGGAFGVLNGSGALSAAIHRIAKKSVGKERFIVLFFLIFWAVGGAFLGNFEECLPFIPMQIALCLALGFDSITGVAIGLCGVAIGYMGSMMNPFTLGIAQNIAGLPIYSGMGFRFVVWLLALLGTSFFIFRYTTIIQANPELSVTFSIDQKRNYESIDDHPTKFSKKHTWVLLEFFLAIMVMIFGVIYRDFYLTEMAGIFIALAIIMGYTASLATNEIVRHFIKGATNMLYPCICVGFARGMTIIMTEGNILDVIVHWTTSMLNHLPGLISAPFTFVVVSIINLFVPSGSGKAVILMPIMVPMADVLGITRQNISLAYHMGDAITNIVSPANATLMAGLAMANIPWTTWMKWFLKIFIYLMMIGMGACSIAVLIHYGPF